LIRLKQGLAIANAKAIAYLLELKPAALRIASCRITSKAISTTINPPAMKKLLAAMAFALFHLIVHAQNVGIGTNTPAWKLDIRSTGPDDGAQVLSVGNSDQSHRILLFGGRQNDPNPYIGVKAGDPIRFATDENGFRELMRINADATVGINNFAPHSSAILDINSIVKGVLIPRMSTSQRTAISSPAKGLLVFDNDTNGFWYFNGGAWVNLSSSANTWSIAGNGGTDPAFNFIGTTDKRSLQFRINNQYAGGIDTSNNIMLGTNTPPLAKSFSSVAIGYGAFKTGNGGEQVAIGVNSLSSNITGIWNTGVGSFTLASHKTGNGNTASGYAALGTDTSGIGNAAFGFFALGSNTNGGNNTAFGAQSLYSNTTGASNTAVGFNSLFANKAGFNNSAFGLSALEKNDSGSYNSAFGSGAAFANTKGYENNAFGRRSLYNNTTGYSNVAIGNWALFSSTTQSNLVALGDSALYNNGTGATGFEASANTALGSKAMYTNTTGASNTATGRLSMYKNTTGGNNTATGDQALYSNTSGFLNTAAGTASLLNNIGGFGNSAFGVQSLDINTSGNYNTAVGYSAGVSSGALTNTTAIGFNAKAASSNTIQLGNADITNVNTYGNLTVRNGKGIIRSSDGTQQKKVVTSIVVSAFITATGTINIPFSFSESFSSAPDVFVGNITGGPGGFAEVVMTISGASATGATLFVHNPLSISRSPNFTVKIIAIGPQ
jgi:hypothetical protein